MPPSPLFTAPSTERFEASRKIDWAKVKPLDGALSMAMSNSFTWLVPESEMTLERSNASETLAKLPGSCSAR